MYHNYWEIRQLYPSEFLYIISTIRRIMIVAILCGGEGGRWMLGEKETNNYWPLTIEYLHGAMFFYKQLQSQIVSTYLYLNAVVNNYKQFSWIRKHLYIQNIIWKKRYTSGVRNVSEFSFNLSSITYCSHWIIY